MKAEMRLIKSHLFLNQSDGLQGPFQGTSRV